LKSFSEKAYDGNTINYDSILFQIIEISYIKDGLELYKEKLPDDQLTIFINAVDANKIL
jgi:hypothetical protein